MVTIVYCKCKYGFDQCGFPSVGSCSKDHIGKREFFLSISNCRIHPQPVGVLWQVAQAHKVLFCLKGQH